MSPTAVEKEMSDLDLTKILDWADRKQRENKTFCSTKSPKTSPNVVELLQKEIRRSAELEAFFKDLDKLRKKEEKKESGLFSKLTTTQLTIIVVVTVPVYVILIAKMLH